MTLICREKCRQEQQRHDAEIHKIEPQIAVLQIAPVVPPTHEAVSARLRECPREKLRCGKQQCDEQEYAPRFYKLYAETLADCHGEQCEHKQNKRCGTNQNQIQKHG